MGKYLRKFDTTTAYEAFVDGDELIRPNVSYVVETNQPFYIPFILTELGDILCANANGDKKFVKKVADIPSDYTPIGVVLISNADDSEQKSTVISLNGMSYSTPDVGCSGTSHEGIRWGGYSVEAGTTSDDDGISNTATLVGLATGQSDWQTADTITNDSGATYYPAACCCWRYSTVGTSQGDWYLPAYNELKALYNNLSTINKKLTQISDNQLVEFCSTVPKTYFWSSTEATSYRARAVSMFGSYNSDFEKKERISNNVRAFYRV